MANNKKWSKQEKGSNNNQRGDYRRQNNNRQKPQKHVMTEEMKKQRDEEFAYINNVCEALDSKVKDIITLRQENKQLSKDDTKIGIEWITTYFEEHQYQFLQDNPRPNGLVSILIDLARVQINPTLMDYHSLIRILYFEERFQSYFTLAYDEEKVELINNYNNLFNTRSIKYISFLVDYNKGMYSPDSNIENNIVGTGQLMDVNSIGKFVQSKFILNKNDNESADDENHSEEEVIS